jgi:hypothetical protein
MGEGFDVVVESDVKETSLLRARFLQQEGWDISKLFVEFATPDDDTFERLGLMVPGSHALFIHGRSFQPQYRSPGPDLTADQIFRELISIEKLEAEELAAFFATYNAHKIQSHFDSPGGGFYICPGNGGEVYVGRPKVYGRFVPVEHLNPRLEVLEASHDFASHLFYRRNSGRAGSDAFKKIRGKTERKDSSGHRVYRR